MLLSNKSVTNSYLKITSLLMSDCTYIVFTFNIINTVKYYVIIKLLLPLRLFFTTHCSCYRKFPFSHIFLFSWLVLLVELHATLILWTYSIFPNLNVYSLHHNLRNVTVFLLQKQLKVNIYHMIFTLASFSIIIFYRVTNN